ncbi:auxin-responsive protein IAA32-like [Salvia miltiorrhiza]|uniref:auxin-responsive protein IAA32-like n=1 Tax=Salvia miltiorrhiza TaxID=226208 RepID=UPI0025ABF8A3|nr:auxin-responsive protein IAA32-like [Salvia miltiorrhiza]XP_057810685.1 auxin-responsive protein IAA32-like [Salvia miltiorrhiza]
MDSNASSYLLNHAALSSYLGKEDSSIIDLGLSLRIVQPDACYSHPHEWEWQAQLKKSEELESKESCEEESEGIESKQRWSYVKVNMDGVVVGRKVCLLDQMDYFTLALHLEDMFGKQSMSGLRLFQADSPFSLFYKDKHEQWRKVGDVPWKEFVEGVRRLRIACKDETALVSSSFNAF